MTNKASGRSAALLAIGLVFGLANVSHAASGTGSVWPQVASPQTSSTDTTTAPATQVVAADQLNDVDRSLTPAGQPMQPATVQPETQSQSAVPVVAASDNSSGTDTSTLIGKIFIGFGTLLTLASAVTKMLIA